MMSAATSLHNKDSPGGFLKRGRRQPVSSAYKNLGLKERKKQRKIKQCNIGTNRKISEAANLADEMKPEPSRERFYGLCLDPEKIDRFRHANTNDLFLNHKKLHLVVDLDHTLLNSTSFDKMSPDEEYLKTQSESDHSLPYVYVVDTPTMHLVTKLRPYVRTFLAQASQMFELSIFTMGSRDYAFEMLKLLDQGNVIFDGRVISRCDINTQADQKCLDSLLAQESAVLILDDTKDVWVTNNQENVIQVPRYHFFKSSCQQYGLNNGKPYSELKTDEYDSYGGAYLANILQVLRNIHSVFFDGADQLQVWDLIDRDVRHVMKGFQKEILKKCRIVFSHIFPSNVKADTHPLWKLAEQLGATCSTQLDSSVTHVVAADPRTHKSCWAVKEGKFLVNPEWIHTANFMWQKQPEENFPCIYINCTSQLDQIAELSTLPHLQLPH